MNERDESAEGLGEAPATPQGDGDPGTTEPATDAPAEQKADASE